MFTEKVWDEIKIHKSVNPDVVKYTFEKNDCFVESVLYKYLSYDKRTVICCSTQSGCPVGCRMCGTGEFFVRSLTVEEIVSQPLKLLEDVYEKTGVLPNDMGRLQIMFMSMGEPLLNFKNLEKAIEILYDLYPKAALLISTIGPRVNYENVLSLCERIPTVGLQFSIHESYNEKRNQLIPFKSKLSLLEIKSVGEEFFTRTGRRPFFNYCASSYNSSDNDADNLLSLFNPKIWEATISVICEKDKEAEIDEASQRIKAELFQSKLNVREFSTRVFDPAGQEAASGCGQLWHTQDWAKQHPELVMLSCGAKQ